ncbi:MAG: CotH kinase family protein [Flavobacteriales bacterium]
MKKPLFILFALFTIHAANAQVVVNEFCTANYSDWGLPNGWGNEFEDWVEFYNPSGAAVNIGGYWLSDDPTNTQKWEFPAGTSIAAGDYLVVLFSGQGDYNPGWLGQLNANFSVTQTAGEDIIFSNASGTILEQFDLGTIGAFQANHSYARDTDGGAVWSIHTNPSQDAANSGTTAQSYCTKPTISIEAGWKPGQISVSITAQAGTTIYYTIDGSTPDNTDAVYAGPINISTTSTLRTRAYSSVATILPSLVETNTYFFGAESQHNVMMVAISGASLSDGQWGGNESTHIEFFTAAGVFIAESLGDSNEHGNDSNAYDQRGFDYITRDAIGDDNVIPAALFESSDRPGYERLIFKAGANDNYPFSGGAHIRDAYVHELSRIGGLHLDERRSQWCVLYINSEYWGVYDMREKVDDVDFTNYYYDQPDGYVDFIKTWGGTWEEYGSEDDWVDLVDFITTNNMTDDASYQYVLTQYNTLSLIDYFILNGYVVCTDWLNWNTAWWRGRHPDGDAKRWKYALWDDDATFGHYVNYTGVPSTEPNADPCQIEQMGDVGGQGHVPVLNALFDNQDFLADYVQRYATLSNTIFSCDRMIEVLDSMALEIDPEMDRQCARWGGTYNGWQGNLQEIRDFILDRCADEVIGGIEDCYDVTAITITVQIDGNGEISFQEVFLDNANTPFSGTYFADLPLDIDALVSTTGCGSFVGWEIVSGTGTLADPNAVITTLTAQTDLTLVAHFSEPSNGPVEVMSDVMPVGAGIVQVNGTAQATYPFTTGGDAGAAINYEALANEWYVFNHWEVNNSSVSPNDESTTITISPCVSDTVIAVYDYTPNFHLTVQVGPEGGGSITMNGTLLTPLPWDDQLEGFINYQFNAVPTDSWSTFSHWEIGGNTLTPDEFANLVTLNLQMDDTLTAVFIVTPHNTVTVMVDPPYMGVVQFEDTYTGNSFATNTSLTVEMAGNVAHPFLVASEEYWNFLKWTAWDAAPAPNAELKEVTFTFNGVDTVIAHLQQEPYTVYIPNSFTPNNDGTNDVFLPVGNAMDPNYYHLMIFNRWGEKVFETKDISQEWEGDVKLGEYYVPDQIYSYFLTAKSVHDAEPREYTGSITIFR